MVGIFFLGAVSTLKGGFSARRGGGSRERARWRRVAISFGSSTRGLACSLLSLLPCADAARNLGLLLLVEDVVGVEAALIELERITKLPVYAAKSTSHLKETWYVSFTG